jgi:ElaB/YqjD/DUF883 family membrane-anchored ribosome-binding protein
MKGRDHCGLGLVILHFRRKPMSDVLSSEKEQFANTINEALRALKGAIEDFAKTAAESSDTAASAVKKAGASANDQLTALSGDAQDYAERGAVSVAKSVAANPLLALGLAVGAGFLIGLATSGVRK